MEREFGFSGVLLWKVRCSRVNGGFFAGKMMATGSGYVRRAADARRKCGGNGGRVWERGQMSEPRLKALPWALSWAGIERARGALEAKVEVWTVCIPTHV
jgi:hypothetical protein